MKPLGVHDASDEDSGALSRDLQALLVRFVAVTLLLFTVGWLVAGIRIALGLAVVEFVLWAVILGFGSRANRETARLLEAALGSQQPNCKFVGGPLHGRTARFDESILARATLRVPILVEGRTRSHHYKLKASGKSRYVATFDSVNRVGTFF